jgi:hypothetical protein
MFFETIKYDLCLKHTGATLKKKKKTNIFNKVIFIFINSFNKAPLYIKVYCLQACIAVLGTIGETILCICGLMGVNKCLVSLIQPQLELEAKEAINSVECILSTTINLPLPDNQ